MEKKVVVGVAGMPGAGKATVVEVATKMGHQVVVMGDEVRREARRRNLAPTPKNIGKVMFEMRQKEGPAVVAKCCIPKIKRKKGEVVVVDGLRSISEVDVFKKHFPKFILLAIHSSPETRYERLAKRQRSDDPADLESFLERDCRELRVGLGCVLALADTMIVNENKREDLKRDAQKFLEKVTKNERSGLTSGS